MVGPKSFPLLQWTLTFGSMAICSALNATLSNDYPQWHLSAITSNPLNVKADFAYPDDSGSKAFIYILDGGILAQHETINGRVEEVLDLTNHDMNPDTSCERPVYPIHGTAVASVAAGNFVGIARYATIVDVRVLGNPEATDETRGVTNSYFTVVSGIRSAVQHIMKNDRVGRAVINLSIDLHPSSVEECFQVHQELDFAYRSGITVVVSAGNHDTNANTSCPANHPTSITVGAVGSDLTRWVRQPVKEGSNWGKDVDIWAPGQDVLHGNAFNMSTNDYDSADGTSLAASLVSGAVANWMSKYGPLTPGKAWGTMKKHAWKGVVKGCRECTQNLFLHIPRDESRGKPRKPYWPYGKRPSGGPLGLFGRS